MCIVEDWRMRKRGGKGRNNIGCGLILCETALDQIAKALDERQRIDTHKYDNLIEHRDVICTEHDWIDLSHYTGMGYVCQHCRMRKYDTPVRPRSTGGGEVV